jgi:integrase
MQQEMAPLLGEDGKTTRRIFRRTGYKTVTDAQADLDKVRQLLDLAGDDDDALQRVTALLQGIGKDRRTPIPDAAEVKRKLGVGVELEGKMTVGELLDKWAASKKTRPGTTKGYLSHIRVHLKPHLGHLRADRLNEDHVVAMFDKIADENEVILAQNAARREQVARCTLGRPGAPKASEREALAVERAKLDVMPPFRRTTGPMTRQRIRATLRAAYNSPMARRVATSNPAQHLEMTSAKRPKAKLWTEANVRRWQETGEKPSPVMVWTPAQFGVFLDHAEKDRLYAYYVLMGFRGLRRGEGVGQDWSNVDLNAETLTVATELIQDGWDVVESDVKTDDSAATIALGPFTAQVLREHLVRQQAEREKWQAEDFERQLRGEESRPWVETGKVFTAEDGSWLHPDVVTQTFRRISEEAELPPINLRDVRHIAATLVHAGGGDLHAIKETLRHSTITLASDTYTSLLAEVDKAIAEKAEGVVPRARRPVADEPVARSEG